MKKLYLLGIVLLMSGLTFAQAISNPAYPEFDPKVMPIAVDLDSAVQLIISDYVLIKSLKTQIPAISRVDEVAPFEKNGKHYLVFTIRFHSTPGQVFYYNILLYKGLQDVWYLSNQSITCGSGCQDCKAGCECSSSGNCPSVSPVMRVSDFPMAKISMLIEK